MTLKFPITALTAKFEEPGPLIVTPPVASEMVLATAIVWATVPVAPFNPASHALKSVMVVRLILPLLLPLVFAAAQRSVPGVPSSLQFVTCQSTAAWTNLGADRANIAATQAARGLRRDKCIEETGLEVIEIPSVTLIHR